MLGDLGLGDLEVMEESILDVSLLMTSNVMKIIINHGPDPSSPHEKNDYTICELRDLSSIIYHYQKFVEQKYT